MQMRATISHFAFAGCTRAHGVIHSTPLFWTDCSPRPSTMKGWIYLQKRWRYSRGSTTEIARSRYMIQRLIHIP
ncbi:hypothetical protein BDZ85DRAFT_256974 [Elsinoe ampelina]|uniref:Uncharacterized protein n=1 Tax=Elsinoe ampelina TaxID=302913 RepID=A0A6A6GMB6_9PEZI|nr:hypothetical protein BDZ85DRAFT_256974 [Elsinoe ampelina]